MTRRALSLVLTLLLVGCGESVSSSESRVAESRRSEGESAEPSEKRERAHVRSGHDVIPVEPEVVVSTGAAAPAESQPLGGGTVDGVRALRGHGAPSSFESVAEALASGADAKVIAHVALIEGRGQEELAGAMVRANSPSLRVLYVGRGKHEEALRLLVKGIGLEGKACFTVFDMDMGAEATKRLQLETDMRSALDRDEIVPYYQPIVSLQTMQVCGFEALVAHTAVHRR